MTIKQYNLCLSHALEYTDKDAYISDLSLSSIWGDEECAIVPTSRIDDLTQIWGATKRTIKDIAIEAGISQRKIAERFGIPYRTVENWCGGQNTCPLYTRMMIQECLGLLQIDVK